MKAVALTAPSAFGTQKRLPASIENQTKSTIGLKTLSWLYNEYYMSMSGKHRALQCSFPCHKIHPLRYELLLYGTNFFPILVQVKELGEAFGLRFPALAVCEVDFDGFLGIIFTKRR